MLKKRLIGVITIKNGLAVQSFGYEKYLPVGSPEILVENLDRWCVDEIIIQCIDANSRLKKPDLSILNKISNKGISTPITYVGGINSIEDASEVINLGTERICLDSSLHENISLVEKLSKKFGSQALVLSLPLTIKKSSIFHYNYKKKINKKFDDRLIEYIDDKLISELLIIDWMNEGYRNKFNFKLLDYIPFKKIPLILFGGITETKQFKKAFLKDSVSAVATGNILSYNEHNVQKIKRSINLENLRKPFFENQNLNFIINE